MKSELSKAIGRALEATDSRPVEMTCMGEAHKKLITACYDHGHQWGEWENVKYTSGSSRKCNRCMLHVTIDSNKKTESYVIGSVWEPAHVATSFINDLAFRSNAMMTGNK